MSKYKSFALVISWLAFFGFSTESSPSFLQTAIYQSDQSTSKGTLANGIEELDSNLSDISGQTKDSLEVLNDQESSEIKITDTFATSTINYQLYELNSLLDSVQSDIDDFEAQLDAIEDCDGYHTCTDCTVDSKCVWCPSEKTCVAGDETGPEDNVCENFKYGECDSVGCDFYNTCSTCLLDPECGWCENYCVPGTSEGSSLCTGDYYHVYGANNVCPKKSVSKPGDLVIDLFESNSEKKEKINYILERLYSLESSLEESIEETNSKLASINQQSEEGTSVEVTDTTVKSQNDGLGDQVDEIYEEEINDERAWQNELADNTTATTVDEINQLLIESENEMNENVDESYALLEEEIDWLEGNITAEIDELEQEYEETESEFNENQEAQAEADAAAAQTTTDTTTTDSSTTSTDESGTETTDQTSTESSETGDADSAETEEASSESVFLQFSSYLFTRSKLLLSNISN
ncbi:unnamed protein product [Blepharisma stoltei]|uniref:PSI domain-containing protein n=1 Tax=Blepharisma stoltei TaxID=1481888 RepID=A0AAU9J783_9CILI|nr:unnamed protein product [Blepharisma stoltei]